MRWDATQRCPPERICRAWTTPSALAKWLPPHGFFGEVQAMDPQVGGHWHMSFTHLGRGQSHGFRGRNLEAVLGERLRYTAVFDDPHLPGEMQTTVSLRAVSCGTELSIEQSGIPDLIPAEMCHLGWQESLTLLAQLVEARVP